MAAMRSLPVAAIFAASWLLVLHASASSTHTPESAWCTGVAECNDNDASTVDWCDTYKGCVHYAIPSTPQQLRGTNRLVDVAFIVHLPAHNANCTRLRDTRRIITRWLREMLSDATRVDYAVSIIGFHRRSGGVPDGTDAADPLAGAIKTDAYFISPSTTSIMLVMSSILRLGADCEDASGAEFPKGETQRDAAVRSLRVLSAVASTNVNATQLRHCNNHNLGAFDADSDYGAAGIEGVEDMCTVFDVSFRNSSEVHFVVFPDNALSFRKRSGETLPSEKTLATAASSIIAHPRHTIAVHAVVYDDHARDEESPVCPTAAAYGRPQCDRSFEDGKQFARGDTLHALQKNEKTGDRVASLQTRLLTSGRYMRTLNATRLLSDTDYLTATRPGYDLHALSSRAWDPLNRRPATRLCDDGTSENASDVGDASSSEQKTSHARHRCPIRTSTKVRNRQWTRDHIVAGHVPVLEWSPTRPFATEIAAGRRPVILRNAAPSLWPAIRKWLDFDYLADHVARSIARTHDDTAATADDASVTPVVPAAHPHTAVLENVKVGVDGRFFDPDRSSAIAKYASFRGNGSRTDADALNAVENYTLRNMTVEDFFAKLKGEVDGNIRSKVHGPNHYVNQKPTEEATSCNQEPPHEAAGEDEKEMYAHFAKLEGSLLADVRQSDHLLFLEEEDYDAHMQFAWLSSAGVRTHTHFDQDHNFFVQIFGEKRFTLFLPVEYPFMSIFPRLHPMWHKSQVDFTHPDLDAFPEYQKARAWEADLRPGDVLYVPPYTWHHVESLTTSISLSTWSHDMKLYENMKSVYRYDHNFDSAINNPMGKVFALRLYLDLMIHELFGPSQSAPFFERLLSTRYGNGVDCLLPFNIDTDLSVCVPPANTTLTAGISHRLGILRDAGVSDRDAEHDAALVAMLSSAKIPSARHVVGFANVDMKAMSTHFYDLRDPVVRAILFENYVEELVTSIVGIQKTYAFMRFCFLGQGYYYTDPDSNEHLLWLSETEGGTD
eukprot:Opistho-2@83718